MHEQGSIFFVVLGYPKSVLLNFGVIKLLSTLKNCDLTLKFVFWVWSPAVASEFISVDSCACFYVCASLNFDSVVH